MAADSGAGGRPVRARLPDGRQVHTLNRSESNYLFKEIFVDRMYLPPDGFVVPDGGVVLDVGANIGLFSMFATAEWPGCAVHAFEPVPAVHRALVANTAGLTGVSAHRQALGSTVGTCVIGYYPGYTMMSGRYAEPAVDRAVVRAHAVHLAQHLDDPTHRRVALDAIDDMLAGRFTVHPVECPMTTVSAALRSASLGHVDLLKVDVEGAELDVLTGIDDQTWPTVRNVAVEVDDRAGRLDAVTGLLRRHSFQVQVAQDPQYRGTSMHMVYARR